jgi:hypothetical protein
MPEKNSQDQISDLDRENGKVERSLATNDALHYTRNTREGKAF